MRIQAFAVALFLSLVSVSWADSLMINHPQAKIRNGPGTVYTILWRPRMFTPLEVLGQYHNWYAVRDVEGDVGWIHNSVVAKQAAAIVTADLVNVRKSPDAKGQIVFQAPKNYTFKIMQKDKGWLKVVDPDKDEGWVEKKGVWDGTTPQEKKASSGTSGKKK